MLSRSTLSFFASIPFFLACSNSDSAAPSPSGGAGAAGNATAGSGPGGQGGTAGGDGQGGTAGGGGGGKGGTAGDGGVGLGGAAGTASGGVAGTAGSGGGAGTAGSGDAAGTAGAGGTAGVGGMGGSAGSLGTVAPHTAPPLFVKGNGLVLKNAKVVSVVFKDDAGATDGPTFLDFLAGSDWIKALDGEYGTGTLTHLATVTLDTAPATIDSTALATLIDQNVANGTFPAAPAGEQGYLYFFFAPKQTAVTIPGSSCILSYHEVTPAHHLLAVDSRHCSTPMGAYQSNQIGLNISQEIANVLTDPGLAAPGGSMFPPPMSYFLPGNPPSDFTGFFGSYSEVSDVCFDDVVTEGTHTLLRFFSNTAAKAGGQYCIPKDASLEFGVTSPTLHVSTAPPGGTVQIPLTAWAGPGVGPLNISLVTYSNAFIPKHVFDKSVVQNGDVTTLSLTVPSNAKVGSRASLLVYATDTGAGGSASARYNSWPLVLNVQ